MGHHNPHLLLQEKKISGTPGAWTSSMFEPKNPEIKEKLLRALFNDELMVVDAYIDKDKKQNEDNYMTIGPGKYIGSQDALNEALLDHDLRTFLRKNPQYRDKIFPKK